MKKELHFRGPRHSPQSRRFTESGALDEFRRLERFVDFQIDGRAVDFPRPLRAPTGPRIRPLTAEEHRRRR